MASSVERFTLISLYNINSLRSTDSCKCVLRNAHEVEEVWLEDLWLYAAQSVRGVPALAKVPGQANCTWRGSIFGGIMEHGLLTWHWANHTPPRCVPLWNHGMQHLREFPAHLVEDVDQVSPGSGGQSSSITQSQQWLGSWNAFEKKTYTSFVFFGTIMNSS